MNSKIFSSLNLRVSVLVSLPTFFGATAFTQQPNYENIAERVGLLNDKSEDQLKKSHLDSAWLYAEEAFGLSKENELIPAQTEAAINMGNVLLRNGDTDSARVCFELALNLSESVKYTKGIGNAYSSLGGMYAGISEYDTAMVYVKKGLNIASMTGNLQGMADGYNNLGVIMFKQGNYPEALSAHLYSRKFSERMSNGYDVARSNSNIGTIYFREAKFDEAIDNFQNALDMQKQLNDLFGMGRSYHNIGSVYYSQGDYENAANYFALALDVKRSAGDSSSLGRTYLNLGTLYYQESFDTALSNRQKDSLFVLMRQNYDRAILTFEAVGDKQGVIMTNNNLGTILIYDGNYEESKIYLMQGLKSAREIGSKHDIMMSYYALASADSAFGNWESAFVNKNLYLQYYDSIKSETALNEVMEANLNFEFERKEMALQAEQRRRELVHKRDVVWQKRILGAVSGIFVLLILFIISYFQRKRQFQKSIFQKELAAQNEKNARAIILAQEDERSRIATDLHDSLGQLLSSARINLEVFSEGVQADLAKSKDILDQAITELHTISFDLMPVILEEKGLAVAVEELCAMIGNIEGRQIHFESALKSEQIGDRHLNYNVYRIIQEALNNALKHANASQINIRLSQTQDKLHVRVNDNGDGFDPGFTTERGNGLKNMQRRAELLGGTLIINSKPREGSEITLEVPVNIEL